MLSGLTVVQKKFFGHSRARSFDVEQGASAVIKQLETVLRALGQRRQSYMFAKSKHVC